MIFYEKGLIEQREHQEIDIKLQITNECKILGFGILNNCLENKTLCKNFSPWTEIEK